MQNFSLDTSCEHGVLDDDSRFVIDADTRAITYTGETEMRLVQKDHNSERCTFEIPKVIDGHDMSKCNVIRIHFVNISAEDPNITNPGLFEVDMTSFGPLSDDPSKLTFSWLVCDDATQLVGTLSFVVELMCRNSDNLVEYAWHTGVYTGGVIERGIDNSNLILSSDKYYDTLNTWITQIKIAGQTTLDQTVERFVVEAEAQTEIYKKAITDHAIDRLVIDDAIVQELGDATNRVVSQNAITNELDRMNARIDAEIVDCKTEVNETITSLKNDLRVPSTNPAIYNEVSLSKHTETVPNLDTGLPENITTYEGEIEYGKIYVVESYKKGDSWGFSAMLKSLKVTCTKTDTNELVEFNLETVNIPSPPVDDLAANYRIVRLAEIKPLILVAIENEFQGTLKVTLNVDVTFEINGVRGDTISETLYEMTSTNPKILDDPKIESYVFSLKGLNLEKIYEVDMDGLFKQAAIRIDANGITSITKTNTEFVDGVKTHTYTILLDNGTTATFDVTDGVGIASVLKTAEDKYEDTYVIALTNGEVTSFKVPSSTAYNALIGRVSVLEKLHGIDNSINGGKLVTPANVRFLSNGFALWDAVPNAIGYRYRIYSIGGVYDEYKLNAFATTITNMSLINGRSISVMAIGDGVNYFDSDWGEPVTYISDSEGEPDEPDVPDVPDEPEKPDEPVEPGEPAIPLSIPTNIRFMSNGFASWDAVPNAVGYKYRAYSAPPSQDSYYEIELGALEEPITKVELFEGNSITVMAIGDGINYSDSEWSERVTYISDEPTIPKLARPVISISDTGLVTWEPIPNAVKYDCWILEFNDMFPTGIASQKATTDTFIQILDGQSIWVVAIGDGINYLDSDWSETLHYTEPDYVYYGVGTVTGEADYLFTSEFVTSLTPLPKDSRVCSFTVSPATQYIYFAAPKNYCINGDGVDIAVFTVNNFVGGFLSPQSLTINGVEYYIYRSANKLTGTITVNVT